MNLWSFALAPEPPPNAPRHTGAAGHVESYFIRANDPERPRALWLKATILVPLSGPAVSETWLIAFDGEGERGRLWAHKDTRRFEAGHFTEEGGVARIAIGDWALSLADHGTASGRSAGADGAAAFDLTFARGPTAVAAPLSILPSRVLREGPFPRSKFLTPYPWLAFDGTLDVFGERWSLAGWQGMQGHNWGREHAFEYAWGQCLFPAGRGAPETMVEGFTGRVRVAGRLTPRMSALVVRRGTRAYRFDTIFDFWRQEAQLGTDRWTVHLKGPDGDARLRMDGNGRPMACLGYTNPDGSLAYCFNTKLADVLLEVRPRDGAPFTCTSAHGGALELLRRDVDPGQAVV